MSDSLGIFAVENGEKDMAEDLEAKCAFPWVKL